MRFWSAGQSALLIRPKALVGVLAVIAFAVIGLTLLLGTSAAPFVASVEPEDGALAGSISVRTSSDASTGSAVVFGVLPKPSATNTGVPAGHTLVVPVTDSTKGITVLANGNVTIYKPGVFENMLIKGRLTLNTDDITIRYSRIEANPSPWDLPAEPTSVSECLALGSVNGVQAIASYGRSNIVIEDSEIQAMRPSSFLGNGIHGSGYTLRRVDISGTVDGAGIFSTTGAANAVIEQSFIHDLYVGPYDYGQRDSSGNRCAPSHTDGVQVHYGANMTIRNNTIRPNSISAQKPNAAIMIGNNAQYPTSSVSISGNWLDYGACSINAYGSNVQGLAITANMFGKNQSTNPKCAMTISAATQANPGYSVSGNTWEDGTTPAPTVTNSN